MKKLLILFLSLILMSTLSACIEEDEPELIGDSTITIEVGDTYTEEGTTNDDVVTIEGTVDSDVVGTYEIKYIYDIGEGEQELIRTVNVVDTTAPFVDLEGGEITLYVGDTYTEPGYSATDNYDGEIDGVVEIDTDLDTNLIGTYIIKYKVTDTSGNEFTVERTVNVIEAIQAPVITLLGDNPLELTIGDTYTDPGVTIIDDIDGDISTSVVISGDTVDTSTEGTYYVKYDATNSNGIAATTMTRTVIVSPPNTAPVITLTGDAVITMYVGSVWVEPGYSAMDAEDGDVKDNVAITGTVDTSTVGTYTLDYDVDDLDGLAATTVTRTVHIVELPNETPQLTLIGDAIVEVYQGATWVDPGVTALDHEDGDITSSVIVAGDTVDTSTIGVYVVTYDVTDSDGESATQITRSVSVIAPNQEPSIMLNGNATYVIFVNDTWTDPGATAYDDYDGDLTTYLSITGTVDTTTVGVYTITYEVTDSDGLTATETRTVTVRAPNAAPVITLIGDETYNLNVGDTWTDPGATALDDYEGDLTSSIIVSGSVDTTTPGTYSLTYQVSDSEGGTATAVIRWIHVHGDNQAPVITIGEEIVSVLLGSTFVDDMTASDFEDGTITTSVIITSDLDTNVAGVYTIEYNVTDSDGEPATTVTRTVHVLEAIVGDISYIYVQQDVTIDLNDAFTEINRTPVDTLPTIDYSVTGQTEIETSNGIVIVSVFDPLDREFVMYPGCLIYFKDLGREIWQENILTVPNDYKLKISLESDVKTYLDIYGFSHGELASLSANGYSGDTVVYTVGTSYYIDYYVENETDVSMARIDILEEVDFAMMIDLEIDEFVSVYNDEFIQEFTFTIDANQEYELSINSHSNMVIEIYDDADNLVIIYYGSHGSGLLHVGTFDVGTYHVKVTQSEWISNVNFRCESTDYTNNTTVATAMEVLLDTPTDLLLNTDNSWIHFTVVNAGIYHINKLFSDTWMDYSVYDEHLGIVSTNHNPRMVYLNPGKYYINFGFGVGEAVFQIEEMATTPTTNNDSSSAITISSNSDTEIYFDQNNIYKWYTFTLTEEKIVHFDNNASHYDGAMVTIMLGNEVIAYEQRDGTYKLPIGTYHIMVKGYPNSLATVFFTEIVALDTSKDMSNPTVVTIPYSETIYLEAYTSTFMEFTLTQTEMVNFKTNCCTGHRIRVYDDQDNLITEAHFDSWIGNFMELDAGTYILEIFDDHSSAPETVYVEINTGEVPPVIYSLDYNNPIPYNPDIQQTHYAFDDSPLYQEIVLTEPHMLFGWGDNIRLMNVYQNDNMIISRDDDEGPIFPIVLGAGTFIIEYTPYESGYIGFEDFNVKPVGQSTGTFMMPEELELLTSFSMSNLDGSSLDVFTINVLETNVYMIDMSGHGYTDFYILDDNDMIIFSSDSNSEMVHLTEGAYTLVVACTGEYYDIYNRD